LEQLMAVGLQHVLGDKPGKERVIELLFTGLFGRGPTTAETASLVGLLNQHTPAQLAVLAAELPGPNLVNLELIGVTQHGLDYTLFFG